MFVCFIGCFYYTTVILRLPANAMAAKVFFASTFIPRIHQRVGNGRQCHDLNISTFQTSRRQYQPTYVVFRHQKKKKKRAILLNMMLSKSLPETRRCARPIKPKNILRLCCLKSSNFPQQAHRFHQQSNRSLSLLFFTRYEKPNKVNISTALRRVHVQCTRLVRGWKIIKETCDVLL